MVEGHQVMIDSHTFDKTVICQDAVKELRASVLLMGACLAKFGEVTISYPGGCSIGKRPIDFHIHAFQKMGAEIVEEEDKMICRCITPLHGAHIQLPFPSVGATENIILAASLAEGETIIGNAAREPEIVELCRFLKWQEQRFLAREPDESELWDRRNSAVFRGLYAVTGLCFLPLPC